jgi:hypothetical protein
VARRDHAKAAVEERIVDRRDRAAGQPEHHLDPGLLEDLDEQVGATHGLGPDGRARSADRYERGVEERRDVDRLGHRTPAPAVADARLRVTSLAR